MALYIPHSIFHLARLLYVRPESIYEIETVYFKNTKIRTLCGRSVQFRIFHQVARVFTTVL